MIFPHVPFLIIRDYKENPRKCTALPLRDLEGFEFVRLARPVPREPPIEVPGGIWLAVGEPPLSNSDFGALEGDGRVIILDASWARLAPLGRRIQIRPGALVFRRSIPGGVLTSYPRRSKIHEDPGGGLATVEAIFVVSLLLGAPRLEILRAYRWGPEFLEMNAELFASWGWPEREIRESGESKLQ